MTLLKAALACGLVAIALSVFGSRTELQTINGALTRRLKTGIAFGLIGIVLALIGLRWEGQNVFRRVTGRNQGLL